MSKIAVFFCVAREKIRPRHAVKFPMPCAWRGVKNFCAGNALWMAQWHADYADTTGWPQIIFRFVAHSSKDCRDFCGKKQGFLLCQKHNTLWNNEITTFSLCFDVPSSKCCVARHNPQASLVFCTHSFAFLCFCVFVFKKFMGVCQYNILSY